MSYTYDGGTGNLGQRTSMSDASGSTAWTYDARGRLASEVKTVTGVGSFKTTWGYNSADLLSWMKYPANASSGQGETITSTYLPQMAINALNGTNVYVQSTQYDAAGRLTLRVLGTNTLRTTQSYFAWNAANGQGRLHFLQTETTTNPPTSLQNLAYAYDAVGNVLNITDQNAGGVQTQTFTYDSLNRLTSAAVTGGTGGTYASEAYTYDEASGNLASKAGTAYGYGLQSDLCNAKSPVYKPHAVMSAGSAIFCYDANGNQIQKMDGSSTNYTYDAENHMTAVSGAATATFVYDGDGKRVKGVVGGVTTTYIGNYFEWTGSTTTMKKYYYTGGTRMAERKGTTLYWLLTDHLGSTSITATSSGSKTAELRYKAWGETRYTYGTTQTTFRYTGQREESSLGLYWYNSRWYSPSLSRFVSPDTIIPQPGNPQAWDRYGYTSNNPINATDPSGHKACSSDGDSFDTCTDPLAMTLQEFSQNFNITFEGTWEEGKQWNILAAAAMVGAKFGSQLGIDTASAFKSVYGLKNGKQFIFGWGSCPECNGAGGYTYSSTVIRFQTLWTNNPARRIPNVIHELGHAFNNLFWTTLSTGVRVRLPEYLFGHAQTSIPGFPDRDSTAPNYGYGGPFGFWQQSREISVSEEFADNFIGWTYNCWEGNSAGETRANWMNGFMPVAIDLASNW